MRDMRMVEGGEYFRFARERLRQNLQRHVTPERGIARAIDLGAHHFEQRDKHQLAKRLIQRLRDLGVAVEVKAA